MVSSPSTTATLFASICTSSCFSRQLNVPPVGLVNPVLATAESNAVVRRRPNSYASLRVWQINIKTILLVLLNVADERLGPTAVIVLRIIPHLLDEVDGSFEVHAEVDEFPLDAFLLVLLLLEDEHVMVEELLQTLVGVVDTQLLERVVLKFNTVVDRNTTSRTTVHQEISSVPSQFNRLAVVLLKILFVIVVRLKARNWAFTLIYQWRNSKNILHF